MVDFGKAFFLFENLIITYMNIYFLIPSKRDTKIISVPNSRTLSFSVFAYHESYRRLGQVNAAHQLMMPLHRSEASPVTPTSALDDSWNS